MQIHAESKMKTKKNNTVEWTKMAHHHVVIITRPDGERIVHSSTNIRYLEKLVSQRY